MFVAPPMGTTKTPSRLQVPAPAYGQRLQRGLVADPLDQDDRARAGAAARTRRTAEASAVLGLPAGPVTAIRRASRWPSTAPVSQAGARTLSH